MGLDWEISLSDVVKLRNSSNKMSPRYTRENESRIAIIVGIKGTVPPNFVSSAVNASLRIELID